MSREIIPPKALVKTTRNSDGFLLANYKSSRHVSWRLEPPRVFELLSVGSWAKADATKLQGETAVGNLSEAPKHARKPALRMPEKRCRPEQRWSAKVGIRSLCPRFRRLSSLWPRQLKRNRLLESCQPLLRRHLRRPGLKNKRPPCL